MEHASSKVRPALLVATWVLVGYPAEILADEYPTTDTVRSQAGPEEPVPDATSESSDFDPLLDARPAAPPPSQVITNQSAPSARGADSMSSPPVTLPPAPPSSPAPPAPASSPLTWYGVTLYGVIDLGVAYLSHGAPLSQTYGPSVPYIIQSYSNRSMTSLASNGLSQSKLGLSGVEPLGGLDLKAVFKLETGFQPTSGRLTDGPKSLVDNNGRATGDKATSGDSARAGQPFQGAAFAGVASTRLGTLTFGRQPSLMADDLMRYDPQLQSQAFSPIGYSGTSGGLGATEDKVLDRSVKYGLALGPVRLAGLYQFGDRDFMPGRSQSLDLGVDVAGLSADLLLGRVYGAVSASSLTAAQNAAAPGTLAATASDNTGYALMLRYAAAWIKLYGGYERMVYTNPKDPLPNGTVTIGGYVLSSVNNTAFTIRKVLQYTWTGVRVSLSRFLDVSGAYYYFRQNSYNANGCSDNSAGSCSGSYHDVSFVAAVKLSSWCDVYTGVNHSRAVDGMAAGFISDRNWTSMTGLRLSF